MATAPNPSTTEWVPVWDLNGVGAGGSTSVMSYRADTISTAASDPGAGKLRWNNATQNLATYLYIDRLTDDGFDATALLQVTDIADEFIIQAKDVSVNNQVWKKTGPGTLVGGDWFQVPVAFVSSSGAGVFSNNQRLAVVIRAVGVAGPPGPAGPAGPPGATGGIHHTQHELGGTDVIQNVAWTNQVNFFTANQVIQSGSPVLVFKDTATPLDTKVFQIRDANQILDIVTSNDDFSNAVQRFKLDRSGNVTFPTGNLLVTKPHPEVQVQTAGNLAKTRLLSATSYDGELTNNLTYDGSVWIRDDVSHGGNILAIYEGQYIFYNTPVGANPAVLTQTAIIDQFGNFGFLGSLTAGSIPDARLSSNVALKNAANTFTQNQTIQNTLPIIFYNETDAPVDHRLWLTGVETEQFYLQTRNDANSPVVNVLVADRAGGVTIGGNLAITGSLVAGTVPDARLSSNVALKNIDNNFVPQTFAPASWIIGANAPYFSFNNTAAGVDQKIWRTINYGDGPLRFEAFNDAQTFTQAAFLFYRNGDFYGFLDASQLNRGTVPLARYSQYNVFTPTIAGTGNLTPGDQTYNFRQGAYVRIGNLVNLWSYTQFKGPADGGPVGAKGTITGELCLTNLPWPIGSGFLNLPFAAGSVAYYSNLGTPQDITGLTCYAPFGQNYVLIKKLRSAASNPLPMVAADVNDSTQLIIHISYFAD